MATFDIWSATALAAVGSNPPTPSFTPSGVRYEVTNDSRSARLQDALGAVSWRALNPQAPGPRSLLVMPPQQWGVNADEATELLRQVESLMRAGLATPRAFTDMLAQPPDPEPYELDLLPRATTDGAPARFVEPIREQGRRITDLFRSMVDVPEIQPSPREFVTPLRDDLLRVLSLSDRRTGNSGQPDAWAQRRLDQTTRTVDNLYRSVTVLPPGGAYTLATEQSPLLLVARNDLPVAIRIRFRIEVPDGAEITDLGEQQLPPKGTRSFRVPTQVNDSRKLVIPISMTTADGVLLGESTSVSVRSNAYGQTLAIMTACAGLLLFLLAGRRLWHRFRGKPDPADEGFDAVARRRLGRYRRARKQLLSAEHAGNE
ncbi:putative secreted protein [Mycobacteroides abscessus subsp. abscessus]|nr:putative secreted protein [Mycobacteroides abscessus subsp. abscessus]